MPYRIKARNQAGSTVTRWDMRNPRPITDRKLAEELAEDFALRQIHHGPWTGFVEYYDSKDSIQAKNLNPTAGLKPKRRGVDAK
jgi:hypothetical protein